MRSTRVVTWVIFIDTSLGLVIAYTTAMRRIRAGAAPRDSTQRTV